MKRWHQGPGSRDNFTRLALQEIDTKCAKQGESPDVTWAREAFGVMEEGWGERGTRKMLRDAGEKQLQRENVMLVGNLE